MAVILILLIVLLIIASSLAAYALKQKYKVKNQFLSLRDKHQKITSQYEISNLRSDVDKERYNLASKKAVSLEKKVTSLKTKTKKAIVENKKLAVEKADISKKITKLYQKKQRQISSLESELALLKIQMELPTTSIDQIELLKYTVSNLDDILKEEHESTDQRLLNLENKLMQLAPIDTGSVFEEESKHSLLEDDLTKIKGLNKKCSNILNDYGVKTYEQLAELSEQQVSEIRELLGDFASRIDKNKWIEQAASLNKRRH